MKREFEINPSPFAGVNADTVARAAWDKNVLTQCEMFAEDAWFVDSQAAFREVGLLAQRTIQALRSLESKGSPFKDVFIWKSYWGVKEDELPRTGLILNNQELASRLIADDVNFALVDTVAGLHGVEDHIRLEIRRGDKQTIFAFMTDKFKKTNASLSESGNYVVDSSDFVLSKEDFYFTSRVLQNINYLVKGFAQSSRLT
jgi:hypothetical protein